MSVIFSTENKRYLLLFVFCSLCFLTVLLPKDAFLFLVQEDGIFEYAGACLFLLSAILFFRLFLNNRRFANPVDATVYNTRWKRIWFLLLGFLFFFLLMEEISWGQRIFGFLTPEWLAERNIQWEFNFHNLKLFNLHTTRPGEEVMETKTGLAAWFTAKKIFVYIFASFTFLLPLGVKFIPFFRDLAKRFYLPIPVIQIGILFIANILVYKAFKPLATGYRGIGRGLAEIEEFNFALILFMVPLIWYSFKKKEHLDSTS